MIKSWQLHNTILVSKQFPLQLRFSRRRRPRAHDKATVKWHIIDTYLLLSRPSHTVGRYLDGRAWANTYRFFQVSGFQGCIGGPMLLVSTDIVWCQVMIKVDSPLFVCWVVMIRLVAFCNNSNGLQRGTTQLVCGRLTIRNYHHSIRRFEFT